MVNSILPKKFVIVKFGRIANPFKKNSSNCWWLISLNFKVWKDCQSFQKSLEGLPILPKKVLLYFDRKNIFWKDWIYEVSILLGTGIFLDLATIVSFHFHIRNVPMKSFGDFGTGKFLHERRSREWRNFEILYESRKAHPNSCASHNFSPWMA